LRWTSRHPDESSPHPPSPRRSNLRTGNSQVSQRSFIAKSHYQLVTKWSQEIFHKLSRVAWRCGRAPTSDRDEVTGSPSEVDLPPENESTLYGSPSAFLPNLSTGLEVLEPCVQASPTF
jgi:hypothetical protein